MIIIKHWRSTDKTYFLNFVLFLFVGLLFQYFIGVEAKAQGNLHVGPLKVNPIFSISESYDDNIFDAPRDKDADLITTLSPGINISSPIKAIKSEASIGYLANVWEYANHTDESHVNQYIDGSFKTIFPYGLGITFRDRFEDTEQPPTFDLVYGQLVQRISKRSNNFSATVALPEYFGRLQPEVYYSNYDIQYDDSTIGTQTTFAGDDSSYNENRIGTRLTYKLFTKLNTLAEFNVGKTNYETNVIGDSEFFESLFGVQFKETAKTTGIFKVGYRIRSYEEDQFDPFKGVVLSYESKTQLTASTLLSVLLRRSQEEALVVKGQPSEG
ncbi:MAG: outer membrane beta-barrel protein [Candidatus Brocadiaceae bacterium]